ncbi:hypothetical protein JX265_013455 [Neoarthrinium moseri]|uniref:Postreplication repair E3 ubiquitin-protein ligase RAD18 n=1 Tax=Neoarthrinium moseri TaxID=1658444 RepID=A0A9P9W8I4_9PEZI|nr:hypothetical protein JX265_013455 [Neoarthrinium moseri]
MNDQDSFEVSDSTDWLSTPLSGLTAVESALRCQVCKDFYKTPMLTSCNHTFCSLCIRRALSNDGKCPLCRANEQEMKLRSNWSMEEVVGAFVKTRPAVLDHARKPPTVVVQSVESPKRRLDADADGAQEPRESKRLRSSTRLSASRGAAATAEMARLEADIAAPADPEQEMDYDDGLVACPICLMRMREAQVDGHIDKSCPGSPVPESQRRPRSTPRNTVAGHNGFQASSSASLSSMQTPLKRPDRLPAMNYSMLKEPQLRKKLAELGVSTAGDRRMLERRHKEWMTIWNANCDSLHPRKKGELLHDLDVWEKTLGTRAPQSSRSINLGTHIKDKDFDQQAWSTKHDASFKDLIANARRNVAEAKKKAKADSATSTDAATSNPDSEIVMPNVSHPTPAPPHTTVVEDAPYVDGIRSPDVLGRLEESGTGYLHDSHNNDDGNSGGPFPQPPFVYPP